MKHLAPRFFTAAALVGGALVFPSLATADCHCSNWPIYVYTESCGYGANCTQATVNLSNAIISEARSFCQQAASPDVCSVSYTPGTCYYESAVGQWLRCAPSYNYFCEVCLDGLQASPEGPVQSSAAAQTGGRSCQRSLASAGSLWPLSQ